MIRASPIIKGPKAEVLAVDDDPFIPQIVRVALDPERYDIQQAESGAEALARMADKPPHLVLLDLGLPDISGFDVLKYMRSAQSWRGVRILMLTASEETDHLLRAKNAGASGYICKPFRPEILAEMVRDVLADPNMVWLDDYTRAYRVG